MARLSERVAIVTGAAGGIGSAAATVLAAEGATVVLADINLPAAEAVAKEVGARGGTALPVALDLAEEDSIAAMVAAALDAFGRIDILHNNAADLSPALYARDLDIEQMDAAVWDRTFRVNIRGTMPAAKHVLPVMRRAARGSIINTASNLALQGRPIQSAYSASKAAIIQLTRSIATSHGKFGIRCNTVSPGLTLSKAAMGTILQEIRDMVEASTLTPYLGDAADIAHVVAFLASDDARYVTGQNIVADGGTAAHIPSYAAMRAMDAAGETVA